MTLASSSQIQLDVNARVMYRTLFARVAAFRTRSRAHGDMKPSPQSAASVGSAQKTAFTARASSRRDPPDQAERINRKPTAPPAVNLTQLQHCCISHMQTVVETKPYLAAADAAEMTESERERVVMFLAGNPDAGDLIQGTGGCRKVRVAKDGTGKSGGYRVISWFGGRDIPVFLLTVFAKGQKANLSDKECNALAKLTATLRASLGRRRS